MLLPVVFEADFPVLLARLQILVGLVVWLLDDGLTGPYSIQISNY